MSNNFMYHYSVKWLQLQDRAYLIEWADKEELDLHILIDLMKDVL